MSIDALVIHPAEPDWIPDSTFESFLREVAFLGDACDLHGTRCFQPGERFFEHIVFRHSHSVIELTPTGHGLIESEPRDSKNYLRIELATDENTGFLCGCNVCDPRCPACSLSIAEWPKMLGDWFSGNRYWSCPECGHTCSACDVNWQHLAGISRYRITVRQVRDGEGVPSDHFLSALTQKSSCEWRYFWYHL